ncbi:MAG TPA: hypothetical protein VEJ63_21575 [Planctomycetota bacterium]|nr:hypothetical protein [Planctomycetota bacterium]
MPKPVNCIVEGCPNPSHAKGYCRRHYGQIWRRGMIYNDTPKDQTTAPESGMRRDDRLKALERELKKAQQMYEVVVGFQGRIKWRREIEAVQHEIRKLTESEASENAEALDAPPTNPADSGITAGVKPGGSGTFNSLN